MEGLGVGICAPKKLKNTAMKIVLNYTRNVKLDMKKSVRRIEFPLDHFLGKPYLIKKRD